MDLPQELIDEIIDHIPQNDWKSLRSCSLVAKSWVHPSRRHIFRAVDVSEATRLKLWLDKISPTNVGVLQHVRSIGCHIAEPLDSFHPPVDFLRDYSPSFRQLESLALLTGLLPSLTQINTYSAFQHTLSYLSLQCCNVIASELITLVNYFPNLAHLGLFSSFHRVDERATPPLSRPLQKLTILDSHDGPGLLDQLMGLRPEGVTLWMSRSSNPSFAQHAIDGVATSVKRLNLEGDTVAVENPLTLSSCQELRELEINAFCPGTAELDLISSITSMNIQRIAFTMPCIPSRPVVSPSNWIQLDDSLCQLVDRLKSGLRLEVEFEALGKQVWWSGERGFKKFLPRFYEKSY